MKTLNTSDLQNKLLTIAQKKDAELSGMAVTLVRNSESIFRFCTGSAFISHSSTHANEDLQENNLVRVASISKTICGIAASSLAAQQRFNLDADISSYLGFTLRNPAFPDSPITARMLLSHRSSLRDGESYALPLGSSLKEFFHASGSAWEDGKHFANKEENTDKSPGQYFTYCNLGFGVLATAIESIVQQRYDIYVKRTILEPIGMEASFNVNLLNDDAFQRLSPIYRKLKDGDYHADGSWTAQVDDYKGIRPALACVGGEKAQASELEAYKPGTNGTLFSPQGGLRASLLDLEKLLVFFLNKGRVNGVQIVPEAAIQQMQTQEWIYNADKPNGDCYYGITRETGLGLVHTSDSFDALGGDRLLTKNGPKLWGHYADAYGLLGGILFHPDEQYGYAFFITGTAEDPEKMKGKHSSFFLWEEEIQEVVLNALLS